jgi:hypothetical protein
MYMRSTTIQEGLLNIAMQDTLAGRDGAQNKPNRQGDQPRVRGAIILIVFFVLFTGASLLIPSPLFPGNVFCTVIGGAAVTYRTFVSAFFNGLIYGVALWVVFLSVSRRLEREK